MYQDQEFQWFFNNTPNLYTRVVELKKDLFTVSPEVSLAHCVAEDLIMGRGIAVSFKVKFNNVELLRSQKQKPGGVAILENGKRFIYYLVTKEVSFGKPTYKNLWNSLVNMREHVVKHKVNDWLRLRSARVD